MTKPIRLRAKRGTRRKLSSVTMMDVAAQAGVSAQTVSRALSAPETVTQETRKRIEDAVRATNYVPNFAASHLASNRSRTVAAIIPSISSSIFAETIQGLNETLLPKGYQLFLGHTDYRPDREEAVIKSFMGRKPDGFFVIGTRHTRGAVNLLKQARVPVVESWDWTSRPIDLLVGFSNRMATETMVSYLANRGYQRPSFAGIVRPGDYRAAERRDGYENAMSRCFPGQPLRIHIVSDGEVTLHAGAELLTSLRAAHPDTDVVIFSSDLPASGALLACRRLGIDVPGELAIAGFGDYELAAELQPSLTTIAVPTKEIGRLAGRLLLKSMQGESVDEKSVDVGFELKARESA